MATFSLQFDLEGPLLERLHTAMAENEAITLYAEDPTHLEVFVGEYDADEDEPLGVVTITTPKIVGA